MKNPDLTPLQPTGYSATEEAALIRGANFRRQQLTRLLDQFSGAQLYPITDATGRTYEVLSHPAGSDDNIDRGNIPFRLNIFKSGSDWRVYPDGGTVFGSDFKTYEPTWDGIPLGNFHEGNARVISSSQVHLFLRMDWQAPPEEGNKPVELTSCSVAVFTDPDDAKDDLSAGYCFRPWAVINPADGEGKRQIIYHTLGFCHFWLFIKKLRPAESGSSSTSSGSSSSGSSSGSGGGGGGDDSGGGASGSGDGVWFPWRKPRNGRWRAVKWSLLLRDQPWLQCHLQVSIFRDQPGLLLPLPAEFLQCTDPDSRRVLSAAIPSQLASVSSTLTNNQLVASFAYARRYCRRRTYPFIAVVEGRLNGAAPPRFADAAAAEHNRRFWSGEFVHSTHD